MSPVDPCLDVRAVEGGVKTACWMSRYASLVSVERFFPSKSASENGLIESTGVDGEIWPNAFSESRLPGFLGAEQVEKIGAFCRNLSVCRATDSKASRPVRMFPSDQLTVTV